MKPDKQRRRIRAFDIAIGAMVAVFAAAFVGLIIFVGSLPVESADVAEERQQAAAESQSKDDKSSSSDSNTADAEDGQNAAGDGENGAEPGAEGEAAGGGEDAQATEGSGGSGGSAGGGGGGTTGGGGAASGGEGGGSQSSPAIPSDPVPEAPDAGGQTSGPPYSIPGSVLMSPFNGAAAISGNGAAIDVSSTSAGYVAVSCQSGSRLKFQVRNGDRVYNYDLPNNGTPIACPINMGNGTYTFRVMQNTSGNSYVELLSTTQGVGLASQFDPYLRPNVFCNYTSGSACVSTARSLASGCANQGDVLRNVYNYIVSHVSYDYDKAAQLANATGYVPNPDSTLATGYGICFDYSSLAAAMLRSLGIPCMIVTGYVEPDGIYHAWNMVYINGSWVAVGIDVQAGTWTRMDTTFAASGASNTVGNGSGYVDVYTY